MAKGRLSLLGAGRQRPPAGAAAVSFSDLWIDRSGAGDNILDIQYDGEVPASLTESNFTIEVAAPVGLETGYTELADSLWTLSKVDTNYVRVTFSGNTVDDFQGGHNVRVSCSGQSGINNHTNSTWTDKATRNLAGNNLFTNLFAVFLCDESSGDLVDQMSGADMTNNNTVPFSAGKVGNAADMTGASSHYFNRANEITLGSGVDSHVLCSWKPSALLNETLLGYWPSTAANRAWRLIQVNTGDKIQFQCRNLSGAQKNADTANFGALSTGTWYWAQGWTDQANTDAYAQVNATSETAVDLVTAGCNDPTGDLEIGRSAAGSPADGSIDNIHIYEGGFLDSNHRAAIYASGNINPYPFYPRA